MSLDYDNLVASCNHRDRCGTYKRDSFDPSSFVSPLQPDCERHFEYRHDGMLVGVTVEGQATVEALNLNAPRLLDARKNLIMALLSWADADLVRSHYREYDDGRLKDFVDMLDQFCADGTFG